MADQKINKLYRVEGMHCASCAVLINKILGTQKGVNSANASFGAEKLSISFDPNVITEEKIHSLIKGLGYSLLSEEEKTEDQIKEERDRRIRDLRNRTLISFALASPVILYYMFVHMFNLTHIHGLSLINLFTEKPIFMRLFTGELGSYPAGETLSLLFTPFDERWEHIILFVPFMVFASIIASKVTQSKFGFKSNSVQVLVASILGSTMLYSALAALAVTSVGNFFFDFNEKGETESFAV